ncbi:MAG: hypothetical protein V1904_06225 [Bacteroidota bacterium]
MIFDLKRQLEAHQFLDEVLNWGKARIEKVREVRSIRQNRLYWLHLTCIQQETGNDKELLHIYFAKRFLPIIEYKMFNEIIYDRSSTADLDTVEFTHYLEKIQIFAQTELNIKLPNPEEQGWDEFFEHYKDFI